MSELNEREIAVGQYVEAGLRYCEQVIDGDVPACHWVRQACKRQLNEFYDPPKGFYFASEAADAVCTFVETLPHVKGEWAKRKELIVLEDWQCFVITTAFGWYNEFDEFDDLGHKIIQAHTRRFKTIYIEVPRKNAKTTMSAGVGLYLFAEDKEPGAEVYTVATKREQAKICFSIARLMALRTKLKNVTVFKHNIHILDDASLMEPLSAESSTMDGLNVHASINDELHAWKKHDLYDVIDTATGSRAQPMLWNITTAGNNLEGKCYEMNGYCQKVLDGIIDDDSFFGVIWTIDKDDDWADAATWRKANPNYAVSVYPWDLKAAAKKANEMVSEQTPFLNKRLNVWTSANEAWMPMRAYMACGDPTLKLEDFKGQDCILGVDLASKNDLACISHLFWDWQAGKKHWYCFVDHFLPEHAVKNAANKGVYDGWVRSGFITTTVGNVLDVDVLEDRTLEIAQNYNVTEIAFDPAHNSTQYGVHMERQLGEIVVEVRPSVLNFSEPMKWMEAWVVEKTWHHNGDPVMTWMVSNVEVKRDHKDGIFPRKQSYERKIDGLVATIAALNRAQAIDETPHFTGRLFVT